MRRRLALGVIILFVVGLVGAFAVTDPAFFRLLHPRNEVGIKGVPDHANGMTMFHAGGCASCHATPGQDDKLRLGGGLAMHSSFGTFHAPNISSHPRDGIGAWTIEAFIRAMREGVSPDGRHYYPAFPYTSYQRMEAKDLADLLGYIKTLAPVEGRVRDHEVPFPFNIRRLLAGWKLLNLDGKPFVSDPVHDMIWNRGAYLVEGPGHCAECHSPRNIVGGIIPARRFTGGVDPEGKGSVPNITRHADGIATWSKDDISEFLKSGETPRFDVTGGSMLMVIRNTRQLSDDDRAAMAAYLASLPAKEGKPPARP